MIPGYIWNLGSVTSVHKEKLRRTVLLFIFSLWTINSGEIPHHNSTVATWWCQEIGECWRESYLSDLVLMMPQREQLALNISSVPDSNWTISRSSNEQIWIKRWGIDAHYFCHVSFNIACWLFVSQVPHVEPSVITDSGKQVLIMMIPADVFYYLSMGFKCMQGIKSIWKLIWLIDIPYTH